MQPQEYSIEILTVELITDILSLSIINPISLVYLHNLLSMYHSLHSGS